MKEDDKEGAAEDDCTPASHDQAGRRDGGEAERPETQAEEVAIRPYEGKIGESGGNLRGREGWFRRRTGGG